jgi:hypothetical protein
MAAPAASAAAEALASRDRLMALTRHFPTLPAFTPVVHVLSAEQALEMVARAVRAGADGVWLISHSRAVSDKALLESVSAAVRAAHPALFIGVNCLSLSAAKTVTEVAALAHRIDGVWCDTMGVVAPEELRARAADAASDDDDAVQPHPQQRAEQFLEARAAASSWAHAGGLLFGGCSFKYIDDDDERAPEDEAALMSWGSRYADVLTTSGPGTGLAMNAAKGPALRNNAAGAPTAVASGVSLSNVEEYRPFVDVYLVASSVQGRDFHELDEDKMRALASKIHAFRAPPPAAAQ